MRLAKNQCKELIFESKYEYNCQDYFSRSVSEPCSDSGSKQDEPQAQSIQNILRDMNFNSNDNELFNTGIHIHKEEPLTKCVIPENAQVISKTQCVTDNHTPKKLSYTYHQSSHGDVNSSSISKTSQNIDECQQNSESDGISVDHSQKRQDRCAWTEEEHLKFLKAMDHYGRKKKTKMAQYIGSRNVNQVISHSQKFFQKISKKLKAEICKNKEIKYSEIVMKFILPAAIMFQQQSLSVKQTVNIQNNNINKAQQESKPMLLFNMNSDHITKYQSDDCQSANNQTQYITNENNNTNMHVCDDIQVQTQQNLDNTKQEVINKAKQKVKQLEQFSYDNLNTYVLNQLIDRLIKNNIYDEFNNIVYQVANIVDMCLYKSIIIDIIVEHIFPKNSALPEQILLCM